MSNFDLTKEPSTDTSNENKNENVNESDSDNSRVGGDYELSDNVVEDLVE